MTPPTTNTRLHYCCILHSSSLQHRHTQVNLHHCIKLSVCKIKFTQISACGVFFSPFLNLNTSVLQFLLGFFVLVFEFVSCESLQSYSTLHGRLPRSVKENTCTPVTDLDAPEGWIWSFSHNNESDANHGALITVAKSCAFVVMFINV